MEQQSQPPRRRVARESDQSALYRLLALGQGGFYLLSGIWPIISIHSFQKVTGPKVDLWLVKAIGALIAVIGAVLTLAGLRRRETAEVPLLAAGSALSLAAIDVVYVLRQRISPIYLLDAAVEAVLITGWAMYWKLRDRQSHS